LKRFLEGKLLRETRFSDVCGTIDEIRSILGKGRIEPKESVEVLSLLEDALHMINRMRLRLEEYERFRENLRFLLKEMDHVESAGVEEALSIADKFRDVISKRCREKGDFERAVELAERIRRIASNLEGALRAYKEKCLAMVELYGRIKGVRDWSKDEEKKLGASLPTLMPLDKVLESLREWLPPEPHRTKLIEFVKAGRAYIQPKKRGQPPIVQFEDGGSIPLHKVRYSERIRNFYPVDSPSAREVARN
jgi:hypothetical protein